MVSCLELENVVWRVELKLHSTQVGLNKKYIEQISKADEKILCTAIVGYHN